MNHVTITREDRVAIVRFDRGIPANPLSYGLMRELTEAARSFDNDPDVSAVILTGRTDNFSMGADLKDPETRVLRDMPQAERRLALMTGMRMCRAWAACESLDAF